MRLITISNVLLCCFYFGCCSPTTEIKTQEQKPNYIWSTNLVSLGTSPYIYDKGLCDLMINQDILLCHATIKDTGQTTDNRLCGLDIKDGNVRWMFPDKTVLENNDSYNGAGYIYDNLLVAKSYAHGSKRDDDVLCINLTDGALMWRNNYAQQTNPQLPAVIGVDDKCYYIEYQSDYKRLHLYETDIKTGNSKTYNITAANPFERIITGFSCTPTLDKQSLIFFTSELEHDGDIATNNIISFDIIDNCIKSKVEIEDDIKHFYGNNGIVTDNNLYFTLGQRLYCYDLDTWKLRWKYEGRGIYFDTVYTDNKLWLCSHNECVLINATNGNVLYRSDSGAFWAYVSENYMYVCDKANKLKIIYLPSGEILDTLSCPKESWSRDGGLFNGSTKCLVDDGKLYIMSYTSVYCYPAYPWKQSE